MAAQGEFHRRFQEAQLISGIVARAFEAVGVDRAAAQQVAQGVGELDFAAAAGVDCLQRTEDLRRQNVASDDRQVRWRFVLQIFSNLREKAWVRLLNRQGSGPTMTERSPPKATCVRRIMPVFSGLVRL